MFCVWYLKCHLLVVGLGWLRDVIMVSQGCAGLCCGCPEVLLVMPRDVWLPQLSTAAPAGTISPGEPPAFPLQTTSR